MVNPQTLKKPAWYKSANITYFSEAEMKKLIDSLYMDPYYEALIAFLYESAARQGEALEVRVKDINWEKNSVVVSTLKQRLSKPIRICPLSLGLMSLLKDRIVKLDLTSGDYLFAKSKGNRPVDRSNLYRKFKKTILDIFGHSYSDRTNPHSLRNSRAIHFLNHSKTGNIVLLSKLLGHTNINNAKIYLRYSDKELSNSLADVNSAINLWD
jgi:integrase